MYLAEDRNATMVDVSVEEVDWPVKKNKLVTVTLKDNGEGMSSREVKKFFDLKLKDIPANNLVLLTKTKNEQLIGFSHDNVSLGLFCYHSLYRILALNNSKSSNMKN